MLNSQKGFASGLLVLLLLVGGIGLGAYLVQQRTNLIPQAAEPLTPQTFNYGWDYNLTHRCVKSVDPTKDNYFQDLTDCPDGGKHWTIAVESEKTLSGSCPGPVAQSFPINNPQKSPVTLNWVPHVDEFGRKNWSVNLKTDLNSFTHPCGAGYFTWAAFMDHGNNGGGTFPKPNQLVFNSTLYYNDYLPAGVSRAIVGWQGFWDDTNDDKNNPTAKEIEINLSTSPNWGDKHPDKDIVVIFKNRDGQGTDFVDMDGKAMGLEIPKMKETKINIPFYKIIQDLANRGIFKSPVNGWDSTMTSSVYLATEIRNDKPSKSGIADLWFTNFRAESIKPISTISPSSKPSPSPSSFSSSCNSDSQCQSGQVCQQVCTLSYPATCRGVCGFKTNTAVPTITPGGVGGSVSAGPPK